MTALESELHELDLNLSTVESKNDIMNRCVYNRLSNLINVPAACFDDSLSAADTQTDARIRQAIAKKFGKASVILISHRITTLSAADKIIVLDRGRIGEEGTHEEQKSRGGIYQKIYETQSGSQEVTV